MSTEKVFMKCYAFISYGTDTWFHLFDVIN